MAGETALETLGKLTQWWLTFITDHYNKVQNPQNYKPDTVARVLLEKVGLQQNLWVVSDSGS